MKVLRAPAYLESGTRTISLTGRKASYRRPPTLKPSRKILLENSLSTNLLSINLLSINPLYLILFILSSLSYPLYLIF